MNETVANVEELQLSNNMVAELGDLKPLAQLPKLARLSLVGKTSTSVLGHFSSSSLPHRTRRVTCSAEYHTVC